MIQIAVELVETVHGRQEFVFIAQVILAELSSRIALGFQQLGNGHILFLKSYIGTRQPYFAKPCTEYALSCDKSGTASGTTLLGVVISKNNAFIGNAVNVGCFVTHHAF